jgi:hypothetical protein
MADPVDVTDVRRLLGKTLQYKNQKIDVIDSIAQGGSGDGLPPGGTATQVLTKVDGTDGNATWQDVPDSGGGTALNYKLPVRQFAPGEVLTEENFEQALRDALEFAQTDASCPTGACITIPRGEWPMAAPLVVAGQNLDRCIYFQGEGNFTTRLYWAADGDGIIFRGYEDLDGDYENGRNFFYGGLIDLALVGAGAEGTGVGLTLRQCVNTQFRNVEVRAWGVAADVDGNYVEEFGQVYNVQNISWYSCHFSASGIGTSHRADSVSRYYECKWNQNSEADMVLRGDNLFTCFGAMFQSGVDYSIVTENPNPGNNRVTISGAYHENTSTSFLKTFPYAVSEGTASDYYSFSEITASNYVDFLDLNGSQAQDGQDYPGGEVRLGQLYGAPTGRWITARGTWKLVADYLPSVEGSPSRYTIDPTVTLMIRSALDSGSQISKAWNSSTSDGASLTQILSRYASEIWDVRRTDLIDLEGSQIAGVLRGDLATPVGGAGNFPVVVEQSEYFNGHPCLDFSDTDNLRATLTRPVVAGEYPTLFAIVRLKDTTQVPSADRGPSLHRAATGVGVRLWLNDINSAPGDWGGREDYYSSGFANLNTADILGHAWLTQRESDLPNTRVWTVYQDRRENSAVYGVFAVPPLTGAACDTVAFNTRDSGTDTAPMQVAYLAALHTPLPPYVMKQVFAACEVEFQPRVIVPIGAGTGLPAGGTTGQQLEKDSGTDGDATWHTRGHVPTGGTTGQVLAKVNGTDFNTTWTTAGGALPTGGSAGDVLQKNSGTDGDATFKRRVRKTTTYTFSSNAATLDVSVNEDFKPASGGGTAYLTGNSTLTLSNPGAGEFEGIILVRQDGTGSRTVTFATSGTGSGATILRDANSLDDSPNGAPNSFTRYRYRTIFENAVQYVIITKEFL